jgi:hypothetical protein
MLHPGKREAKLMEEKTPVISLVFADTHNTKGKVDGDEFGRQATRCGNAWDGALRIGWRDSDNHKRPAVRRKAILDEIKRAALLAGENKAHWAFGFFCHGWPTGLSLGFKLAHVPELADAIAEAVPEGAELSIGLFACSTGRSRFLWRPEARNKADYYKPMMDVGKRDGFAMLLCAELAKRGRYARITAHLTSGHTTRNPHKVRIQPVGQPIEIKRERMVDDGDGPVWGHWRRQLRDVPSLPFKVALEDKKKRQG